MIKSKGMTYIYKVKDGQIVADTPIEIEPSSVLTNFDLSAKSSVDFSIAQETESKKLEEFLKSRITAPKPHEGQKVLVRAYGFNDQGEPVTTNKYGYATQNKEGDLCLTFY